MIKVDMRGGQGLEMRGSLADVSAECVLILEEIYKKNLENFEDKVAVGIMTNIVLRAISEVEKKEIEKVREEFEEKMKEMK